MASKSTLPAAPIGAAGGIVRAANAVSAAEPVQDGLGAHLQAGTQAGGPTVAALPRRPKLPNGAPGLTETGPGTAEATTGSAPTCHCSGYLNSAK